MRQQRTQMSMPASTSKGYALIVDGQTKKDFETRDHALKSARELKARFPNLQVKVFNADNKQSETVDLVIA